MTYTEKWARLGRQLSGFGYLPKDAVTVGATSERVSPELTGAIAAAQQGLHGTTTVHDRIRPSDIGAYVGLGDALDGRFCGTPDHGGPVGHGGVSPLSFGSPGGHWSHGNLRISIDPTGCNIAPPANPATIISGAFTQWQTASTSGFFQFTFVPTNAPADIRVVFGGQNVDPRFGSRGGVLASAAFPEGGAVQFDSAEIWTANKLLGTALHEIGHALGLSHSNRPGGTMYPYANTTLTIDAESRDAITALYGWQPQHRLDDRGTTHRASLGVTSVSNFTNRLDTPHMVWKGVGDDSGVYFSELHDDWTPQQRVEGVGCSYSPALTEIGIPGAPTPSTGLLMAWKGVGDDQGLYWTRNLGVGWEGQRGVADVGSNAAPALANVNGVIHMAWKGVGDDSGIYWSTYDGGEGWSPQIPILGVGTSDSPALVSYNGMLYMFWKGIPGDSNAYYSFFDFANDPIWKPQRRIEYFSYEAGGGVPHAIGTSGALSATVRNDSILLTWKGAGDDQAIWFSLFKDGEFSGQAVVPDVGTSVGPSVVEANGSTFMAWKGVDGDSAIYWTQL